jgi:hypothetical protein
MCLPRLCRTRAFSLVSTLAELPPAGASSIHLLAGKNLLEASRYGGGFARRRSNRDAPDSPVIDKTRASQSSLHTLKVWGWLRLLTARLTKPLLIICLKCR